MLKIHFLRMVRRLIWPRPVLYAPIGILRRRGNVLQSNHEIYIGGYPRSGNTFAAKAFAMANPGAALSSHNHIPTFVLHSSRRNIPGMVLIRNPVDAAVSWAIYQGESVRDSLAYYDDYHRILAPYRDTLMFVRFEDLVEDFGRVMVDFNNRWGTTFAPFQHTPENCAACMKEIDAEYLGPDGKVIGTRVARPAPERKLQKEALLRQINCSGELQKALHRANKIYQFLAPKKFTPKKLSHKTTTTQSIRLRPVM